MTKLRIQIVNYKTKVHLIKCLESLVTDLKDFNHEYSVAILENASGEDLSDISNSFPTLKNLEIHYAKNNLGFGGGHNFLSHKGEAEYILILNPDIEFIESKTTERLLKIIENKKAQVVGPRLVTTEKHTTQWWDHAELRGLKARVALGAGESYWKEQNSVTEVAWVSGAVMLIYQTCFNEIGGFDESFFLYKEEEDLCLRIREKEGRYSMIPLSAFSMKAEWWLKKKITWKNLEDFSFRNI